MAHMFAQLRIAGGVTVTVASLATGCVAHPSPGGICTRKTSKTKFHVLIAVLHSSSFGSAWPHWKS